MSILISVGVITWIALIVVSVLFLNNEYEKDRDKIMDDYYKKKKGVADGFNQTIENGVGSQDNASRT